MFFSALCTLSKRRSNEIFDINPAEILDPEIDDLYEMRFKLNQLRYRFNDTVKQSRNNFSVNVTTEGDPMTPVPPEIVRQSKIEMKRMKTRMLKRQLMKVLTTDLPSISEYMEFDDPTVITEKFDKLVAKHRNTKFLTRREEYHPGENQPSQKSFELTKWAVFQVVEHFTYIARYKLVLSQVLKKKYSGNFRYRLGYLFSLLRHLKNTQKWLQWAYKQYAVDHHYYEVKMLQKIMRLDVDIRDVVAMIKKAEYDRNMLFDPFFYDVSLEKK